MKKQRINPLLYQKIVSGDMVALAYAISVVENNSLALKELLEQLNYEGGHSAVIGFTGPPGVGKSTLINAYIENLRRKDTRVAVVAIDPSSPISGGAILGDRFRMNTHVSDPSVFIRSVSNRGHPGGLCAAIFGIISLIDAAGWDVILLETVGAGQNDTDLDGIADINVVIQSPGLGDDLQAMKSGILEIADILVVNKADLPLVDRTIHQLQAMLELRRVDKGPVSIVRTIATEGFGIESLQETIEKQNSRWKVLDRQTRYTKRMQRIFAREVAGMLERSLKDIENSELLFIYEKFLMGELNMKHVIEKFIAGFEDNIYQALAPSDEQPQKAICRV